MSGFDLCVRADDVEHVSKVKVEACVYNCTWKEWKCYEIQNKKTISIVKSFLNVLIRFFKRNFK